MTKGDIKYFLKSILPITLLIGLFFGMSVKVFEQIKKIDELEQRLAETQEQLYIKDDILKQIYMYNEREYYMDQIEDDTDA